MRRMMLVFVAGLTASALPAPAPALARTETAVLAGGCFWGMEAVFEHVQGVSDVTSGYAGGSARDATYDQVSAERTGHAEAVRIRFDPAKISYAKLLHIYFTVAHDPTQLNRQGPDTGASYRSAVFPLSKAQEAAARAYIARAKTARPVVTRIERGAFYPAEAYHQDFARKNPLHPYIVVNDRPKVAALRRQYPAMYKG